MNSHHEKAKRGLIRGDLGRRLRFIGPVDPVGGKNAVEKETYAIDLGGEYFTSGRLGHWPESIGGRPRLPSPKRKTGAERNVQTMVAPTGKVVSLKLPDASNDDGGRRPRATR